jgi:PelA/Pel-15E family pectate lyase
MFRTDVMRQLGIEFFLLCLIARTSSVSIASDAESHELATTPREKAQIAAIDVSGFHDGANHWRRIRDDRRVIQAVPGQPAYSPAQIREIAANVLLFQRANGGWPKDYDMLAILTPEQVAAVRASHHRSDTSFDNDNIHTHVDYLARACFALGEAEWRNACLRGFDFMLASQLPGGGFPQRYPKPTGYHAHITYNDGVTIGILNVLKDAADGAPQWHWLDAERRHKAQLAVNRGIECILRCQIRVDDNPTGWCQQHHAATYEAASARTFELASCCPQETTQIVRFLMRIDSPDERIVRSIEHAVAWLGRTRLPGIRVEKVQAPVVEFERHRADFDAVVVPDAAAEPIWARHYEFGTDRPIFAGRDGMKRYALSDIERERRTGTPWYGKWPAKLLAEEYPQWRTRWVESGNGLVK